MKLIAIAVVGMGLAGCQGLVGAQRGCTERHARFAPMWDCIKGEVAANRAGDMNNDLGLKYMAFGEALAARVKGGQMSDADAKYALANELSTANTEYKRRQNADVNAGLLGLAIAQQAQPRTTSCTRNISGGLDCTTY